MGQTERCSFTCDIGQGVESAGTVAKVPWKPEADGSTAGPELI